MSNLLSQASLVMIPSGYKEDVVYSQIPTSGAGDLSFTRASNGTRVNSAGLVEVCPWNFIEYSEQFTSAAWATSNGATVSADQTTAPNGTTTADKIVFPANSAANIYNFPTSPVGSNNISVYAKTLSGTKQFRLRIDTGSGPAVSSNFTATTEWQRFDFAVTTTAANLVAYIFNDSTGVAGDLYVWGAQLNIGSTAKPYFPTTDRLNVPRLTYQNGGGGCPSLLLEKQSTNLVSYSEQFDNATWNKYLGTVTADTAISPDGTQNADLIYPSSTGSLAGQLFRQISSGISSGNVVTVSAFVKASGKNFAYLSQIENSFSPDAYFNLTTGAITNISSGVTASMTQLTNGWWRISITSTAGAGSYYAVIGSTDSAGNITNTASGTNGILVYGYQVEVSSYPTSYIPTTSSSATRVADVAYKSSISSLFGASATSFFMDFEITQASSGGNWTVTGYDGSNLFSLCQFDTANNYPRIVFDGGVDTTLGTALSIGRHKIAVSFATNDFRAYIDGALVLTDTSCTYNRYDRIAVNGTAWTGNSNNTNSFKLNQYAQFPNTLTNAELASLTTI